MDENRGVMLLSVQAFYCDCGHKGDDSPFSFQAYEVCGLLMRNLNISAVPDYFSCAALYKQRMIPTIDALSGDPFRNPEE
jgi:hypothetical protein